MKSIVNIGRRAFHSSSTTSARTPPSKAHFHQPIPSESFPRGYLATGLHAGVKKSSNPNPYDLALVASTTDRTSSAGCFTRNVFKAAPVQVSKTLLLEGSGRANRVVVNSGCANAVTGSKGLEDAWAMSKTTDEALGGKGATLVMSTGVIGQLLPIDKIISGIKTAASSFTSSTASNDFSQWELTARAFMTTDTFPKLRAKSFSLPSYDASNSSSPTTIRFAGIDKGAGMIHPNMGPPHATLLGLILTDAAITPKSLQNAVTYAVERSFNSISVDGDMSTNDTVLAMANGAAYGSNAVEELDEEKHPEAFKVFRDELTAFAVDLAKLVVRDGEGATKFVTVTVKGAPSYEDAHRVASSISTSSLVKCALYGEDANWGRILCAVGYAPLSTSTVTPSQAPFVIDPSRVSVSFIPSDGSSPLALLVNGEPEKVDEARASEIIGQDDVGILVELGGEAAQGEATYWTCDLSHEYVTINGDYRS